MSVGAAGPFLYRDRKGRLAALFLGALFGVLALICTFVGAGLWLVGGLWLLTVGNLLAGIAAPVPTLTVTAESLIVHSLWGKRHLPRSQVELLYYYLLPYRMFYYWPVSGKPCALPTPKWRNFEPVIDAMRARGWPVEVGTASTRSRPQRQT